MFDVVVVSVSDDDDDNDGVDSWNQDHRWPDKLFLYTLYLTVTCCSVHLLYPSTFYTNNDVFVTASEENHCIANN